MEIPAWSYSSLTAFETCAKQYYFTRVSKEVERQETDATRWGNEVHKALELRLTIGQELPASLRQFEGVLSKLLAHSGEMLVEHRMALNADMTPGEWDNCWCRGIVDVGVVDAERAVLLDWKTGKRKMELEQLKLFAGFTFAHYPKVRTVSTGFVWLKEDKVDQKVFTRDDTTEIWSTFIPRVKRLEKAYENNVWLAKPSGLCRGWCPVPKRLCEFSSK